MANNIHDLFKSNLSQENKEITFPCKGALQPIKPIIKLISSSSSLSEIQPERIIRKKDWKEKELIEKNSQLDKHTKPVLEKTLASPFFADKSPDDLPLLIGQLNGDRMISHTPLEEIPLYVGTQIAEAYLEGSTLSPELNEGIQQLAQIARDFTKVKKKEDILPFAKKLMTNVLELQEGKSFFALGSCVENKQRSSIIYEFHKNQESYDLFVYMIGKENGVFDELSCEGNRSWVRPFMHFKEIPPKELFFSDTTPLPDLFQALVETFLTGKSSNYAVLTLLGKMEPYLVPSSQEMKGFLSAAHSHTNAWREISGIFFRYLGREKYRQVSLDLKMSSLIEGYQLGKELIQEDSVEGSELREVLKAGAKNILNHLVRYKIPNLNYKATALDLLNRIASQENEIAKGRLQKSVLLSFIEKDESVEGKSALSTAKKAILPCAVNKHSIVSKTARIISLKKPEEFAEQLKFFNEGFSKVPEVEKIEIEHLVLQFALPENQDAKSPYWTKIPVESLPEVIQGLETVLKHYDLATRKGAIHITSKETNTVYSLFVIIHFLALRLDKRKNTQEDASHPSLTDEAELLKSDSIHPVERRALQPGLQPHHMLSDYKEERIHLLADPEKQTLFDLEFFRSVISSQKGFKTQNWDTINLSPKKEWFPLYEELKQPSFVKECKNFIHAGVEHYYDLQLGGRPNVFATLFFIRLACRIERFSGKPLINSLKYIHNMLNLKDLTDKERSALSLHLVLAYSEQKKGLTDLEVKEVFEAWAYYQNTPLDHEWKNPLLEKETTSFVHTLIPSEKSEMREESFQRSLLSAILKQFGMRALPKEYEMMNLPFPTIKAEKEDAYWEINLLTGKVSSQQGILARGAIPQWIPKESISRETKENAFYKYFFNSREHTYFQMGSTYHFEDPCLGPMRVINGDILKGLQRNIDSKWYQYAYPQKLTLPSSLLADHTHWIPVENPDHLLICDFAMGEKRALLTEEGKIHPFEKGKIDLFRTLHSAHEESVLQKMDQKRYILCTDHENQLEKITFSRFHSLSGEELYFEMKDKKAVFGLNRKYHLNERQQFGLLGGISEYLLLIDGEGKKQKVLIPRRPLSDFTPLTSHHTLSTNGTEDGKDNEFVIPQKGSATFLEYDLKGGRLTPLSAEANLQLAYLYLAQREYVKAKELIKKIPFKEPLSKISTEILSDILEICEKGKDASPESAAVVLWAYRLGQKAAKRILKAPSLEKPNRAFAIYSRYQQTIPSALEYHGKMPPLKNDKREGGVVSSVEGIIQPLKIRFLPHSQLPISQSGDQEGQNYSTARDQTAFLHENGESKYNDPNIILSTQYGKGYATGGFFRAAYAIALKGTEEEKNQLRFRLELLEGMRKQSSDRLDESRRNEWTILQLALRIPEKMPELPPAGDVPAGWQYLLKVGRLISEVPTRSKKAQSEPVNDPLPLAAQLKTVFPEKKKAEMIEERLLLVIPDKMTLDEGFLQEIFPKHLKPVENSKPQIASEQLSFTYDPSLATSEDEKAAESAIIKEFAVFAEGYKKGKELNQERTIYAGKDLDDLKEILQKKGAALSIDVHNLEGTILEIANKRDPKQKESFSLLTGSKVEQEISLKKMIWHFLGSDKAAFKKANSYLDDPTFREKMAKALSVENKEGVVIDYLYNLIGLYLTTAVYKQRLERAQVHIEKILSNEKISDLEKKDLVQKVAYELNPETLNTYLIAEHPEFLVFEYYTGFYIRSDQVEILSKFLEWDSQKQKLRNQLTPLRPGGGKTAVVAAIRIKIAAGKGRLPFFCTTTPQYASASQNLRKTLKECFDQDMEEIDFSFDEIYEKCEIIEKRMKKALERGDFLPVKSEMLLCLQLRMLTAAFAGCGKPSDKLKEINTLRRILELIKGPGELLLHEIDLILSVLREMNFPQGEKQHVAPERIDLIRELFLLFVSGDLKELIKLEENRQTLLSETDFKEVVGKAVALKFTKESNRLLLQENENYHLSFYRYITGKMNFNCQKILDIPEAKWDSEPSKQDLKDLAFLRYLRELRESTVPEKEEASHQIALVKQMMLTVLPSTFQKMVNRNYGRGNDKPGEVRPFEGNEATNNYFGYIYEWIAYHFQTVLQAGMGGEQISLLAAIYREGAVSSLKPRQLVEDEKTGEIVPPEALEFKNLTGIELEEVDNPEKLKIAVDTVNKSVEAKLQLEAETASDQVIFHPYRVTANGFSLANMSNPQGMSATLNNAHCFEDCLADAYTPQPEIVGQIAHLITERFQTEKKQHLHFVRSRTLDGILETTIANHPEKKRIGMLLDSGALFKDVANLEVAKGLRGRLHKPVLFFTNGILTLLPFENDNLRFIKTGTRVQDIEGAGVSMDDCVVYLAEKECTGSDFVMPYDTIGIMTWDETILDRAVWQTTKRLRKIEFEQRLEHIMPVDILPFLLRALKNDPELRVMLENEEELTRKLESDEYLKELVEKVTELKIISAALHRARLNEAITKAKEYGRSRKQKIDSLFEQSLLSQRMLIGRDLIQEDLDNLGPYKKLLELPQQDSPYDQFGALEVKIDSIEDLTAYGSRRLTQFRKAGGIEEEAEEIEKQIKLVIEKAARSPWLLKTTPSPGVNELGMEVDILNEVTKNTTDKQLSVFHRKTLWMLSDNPLHMVQPNQVRSPLGNYPTLPTELSIELGDEVLDILEQQFDNSPLAPENFSNENAFASPPQEEEMPSQNNHLLSAPISNLSVVNPPPPFVLPQVDLEQIIHRVVEEQPAGLTRCQVITRIALNVIGILCLAATIIGIFATVGLHVPGAPQFMVTIGKSLPWDFTAYILTAAGPTYLFGLGIYALVQRRRREAQIYRG